MAEKITKLRIKNLAQEAKTHSAGLRRVCQNCNKNFEIASEDFAFYEKIKVSTPTWCPECRLVRRMMLRNERAFYKGSCGLCGKFLISTYSPDKAYKFYCPSCWRSDEWDAASFAREYDFKKSFFEQLDELSRDVPQISLHQTNNVNCEWTNREGFSKNCYFDIGGFSNEDSAYNNYAVQSKDVFDNLMILKSNLAYQSIFSFNCYKLFYSLFCFNCQETYFSFNCRGCSNIIGCTNLRNKNFYIFNKPVSKDEFISFLEEHIFSGRMKMEFLKEEVYRHRISLPHIFRVAVMSVNCIGDFIENSKNCFVCFNAVQSENSKYLFTSGWLKDCYDVYSGGINGQLFYEYANGGSESSNLLFSEGCRTSRHLAYCKDCENSSYLFGCIGLRNKQYCILNKQYSKEAFVELRNKIIEHMEPMPYKDSKGRIYRYGEFFPPELSPFAYNETVAQEYFPLTKEQAIEQGYRWKDPDDRDLKITMTTEQIPDHIKDVPDTIINEVIQCAHKGECNEQCTTAFKIIKAELEFYRKMNLPLPRLCPNCRHYQRIKQRNPLKLWKRKCQCAGTHSENGVYKNTCAHNHGDKPCSVEFETTYSPDRPEIVYCEACYNAEVV